MNVLPFPGEPTWEGRFTCVGKNAFGLVEGEDSAMDDELQVVEGDVDLTITINTPEVEMGETPITDEMRTVMGRVTDPNVDNYTLTFAERKLATNYSWL